MRWSETETQQFVKIYLSHKCLWDSESEDYRLKFRRLEAYRNIIPKFYAVSKIKLNEREVRVKIKNLKATYAQELVKIKQRSTAGYEYRSTLRWFADWHKCYKKFCKTNEERSCDDLQEQELTEAADDSQKVWVSEEADNIDDDDNVTQDPFVSPTQEDYILILKNEHDQTKPEEAVQSTHKIRKRKMKCRTPSTDYSEQTFRGSLDSSSESTVREDEFDIYGKYVASQLRRMGLQRALRVQLQIQSIVSEARIEHLMNQ